MIAFNADDFLDNIYHWKYVHRALN
jgi:hypothetical protein